MKKLILATCLALCSMVHAGEIVIKDELLESNEAIIGSAFVVNESLGQAWVALTFKSSEMQTSAKIESFVVKGMAFDKTSQEIYLTTDSGRIVCAYQKTGLFGMRSIRPTDNCSFKKSIYAVAQGDRIVQKYTISLFY